MALRIGRLFFAVVGSSLAAWVVAIAEGLRMARDAPGPRAPSLASRVLADLGVLAPVAVTIALGVGMASLFLEPGPPKRPWQRVAALRDAPLFARSRIAAIVLLGSCVATGWLIATAETARPFMGNAAPLAVGSTLAVTSMVWLAAFSTTAVAVLPPLRRSLESASVRWPWAVDPVATGAVGLAFCGLVIGLGIYGGDTGGEGARPLAIFGVLKRPELDLRPVAYLAVLVVSAWLAPVVLAARAGRAWVLALGVVVTGIPPLVTVYEAVALERVPSIARDIERYAPLGRLALSLVRRATDRDHDGASAYFGGGDCDDTNPNISPFAVEIPGNGVDEDCSGADLPIAAAGPDSAEPPGPAIAIDEDYNLVLITVDTLRADEVGFLGYDKPTTPNLDALALQSVVFERAYAMASYTGKALGPMLIGKYPSETLRDGGHFNKYAAANTFLAERLKTVGVFAMGAASHWYFRESWGLTQGFDVFDLSAIPEQGQGAATDSTTTGAQLTDAALGLLARKASSGRFFFWIHYFDPHEQYVAHPGAPDLSDTQRPPGWRMRAAYDGEVWFTDQQIGRLLDYASRQPWWKNTVVVVTSDHGEAMNEHGMPFQHGFELWDPLVRVPLLMRVPGVWPHRVPAKRSVIDLVPTLLDVMGVARPEAGQLSGQSLIGDLMARPGARLPERDVFLDMPDGPYTHMRRGIIHGETPGMKLIHFGGRQYQLYDLGADPGEREDLAGDPSMLGPMIQAMVTKRSALREIYVKPDVFVEP